MNNSFNLKNLQMKFPEVLKQKLFAVIKLFAILKAA